MGENTVSLYQQESMHRKIRLGLHALQMDMDERLKKSNKKFLEYEPCKT